MTTLWTRGELKDRAKKGLETFYWQAFLVCLIAMLLGAGTEASNFQVKTSGRSEDTRLSVQGIPGTDFSYGDGRVNIDTPLYNGSIPVRLGLGVMFLTMLMVTTVVLALGILVSNVLQVGKRRYFLKKTAGIREMGVGELFSAFGEAYGNLVWVMFRRQLSIVLWSLLLVIPGIIKTYEYYLVPYLLAEDPHLSWEQARNKSCGMMDGNKIDVFVLQLSFIGWDILGSLLCGVGHVFVAPYKEAVYAELYHTLRNGAGGTGYDSSYVSWQSER